MKPLRDMLTAYQTHRTARRYSGKTISNEKKLLLMFLCWLESWHQTITAGQLTRAHLEAYLRHLTASKTPKGTPLTAGYINTHISAIRSFIRFLTDHGHVSQALRDALPYVKEPKRLPTSVLPHREIRELLDGMDTTTAMGFRNRTILELLYTSGMRRAELLGLKLGNIDFDNGLARVIGKGNKERVVPIGKTALRFLTSYVKAIRPMWRGSQDTDLVFLNVRAQPLNETGLRRMIEKICAEASVHVTPHTFRRSCTTELVRANCPLYHVKEMLGHESLDTLAPYTKLTITDLKKAHARCHPRERDDS